MTTEVGHQDRPNSDTRQDAKHWNITKIYNFFFPLYSSTTKIPSHRNKVNAEQSTPLLQYNNQGGHAIWYPRYLCSIVHRPPMSKLAQVNEAMVTLANCMWTTVPQIVYYRLKAWIAVSTPPRASNLSLERYLQQNICTPLCFRTTLITNAAPPRKGRDSVKLTALSTVIPETPRTKRELNF